MIYIIRLEKRTSTGVDDHEVIPLTIDGIEIVGKKESLKPKTLIHLKSYSHMKENLLQKINSSILLLLSCYTPNSQKENYFGY
jgi:hypothetical protein